MNAYTSKLLFFILAAFIITMVSSVIYHLFNQKYETETAVYATAEDSMSFHGVYIRDEEILTYDAQGAVSYAVSDGGKLGVGTTIAEIYDSEEQIEIKQQLADLNDQLEVLNKIENPGTSEVAQPAFLSNLIAEKYKSVVLNLEKQDIESVEKNKEELLTLFSAMQMVVGDSEEYRQGINQKIQAIQSEITSLTAMQSAPLATITSEKSSYFVSYTDGYETQLNMENTAQLTPEFINSVVDNVVISNSGVLGKIIDNYTWYVAGVIDNSKMLYSENDVVTVKFESTSQTAQGVIKQINATANANESVIIIECSRMTYELVQHRAERVEIVKGSYEGVKVPRKAIRFKDVEETVTDSETGTEITQTVNYRGVYVKLGEQVLFKKLDVVFEADDYVLSALNKSSDYVLLYDDIIVEGVDADGN